MTAVSAPDQTFLSVLNNADRAELESLGRVIRAPRGAILMYQGELGERVMIVLAGRVKVSCLNRRGREALVSIVDPGELIGELSYIDGGARSATVTALEPVEVLVIPASVFCAYAERRPRVSLAILESLARRTRDAMLRWVELCSTDTLGRLCARLVELVERYGMPSKEGAHIALELTQDDLVAWTGASRAGVAKALQTLRELGWLETHRRRIVVRNLEGLRAHAAL